MVGHATHTESIFVQKTADDFSGKLVTELIETIRHIATTTDGTSLQEQL